MRSKSSRSSGLEKRTPATNRTRMFWAPTWRLDSGTSHRHNNNTCRNLLAAWNRHPMVAICNNHLWDTNPRWSIVQVWPQILNHYPYMSTNSGKTSETSFHNARAHFYFHGYFDFSLHASQNDPINLHRKNDVGVAISTEREAQTLKVHGHINKLHVGRS